MTDSRKAELAHNTKQLLIALDQAANAAMGFVAALVALWARCRQAGLCGRMKPSAPTAGAGISTEYAVGHAALWMAWRSSRATRTAAWKATKAKSRGGSCRPRCGSKRKQLREQKKDQ